MIAAELGAGFAYGGPRELPRSKSSLVPEGLSASAAAKMMGVSKTSVGRADKRRVA